MVKPSAVIVVDANILISAILGDQTKTHKSLMEIFARRILIATTDAIAEAHTVLSHVLPEAVVPNGRFQRLLLGIEAVQRTEFEDDIQKARLQLRRSAASLNGSTKDDHVLASAWVFEADIWSHDRDFAGCGWPSWSTANLRDAVMEEGS